MIAFCEIKAGYGVPWTGNSGSLTNLQSWLTGPYCKKKKCLLKTKIPAHNIDSGYRSHLIEVTLINKCKLSTEKLKYKYLQISILWNINFPLLDTWVFISKCLNHFDLKTERLFVHEYAVWKYWADIYSFQLLKILNTYQNLSCEITLQDASKYLLKSCGHSYVLVPFITHSNANSFELSQSLCNLPCSGKSILINSRLAVLTEGDRKMFWKGVPGMNKK